MSGAVDDLRGQLDAIASDRELDAGDRVAGLRDLREKLIDLAGYADRLISGRERVREGDASRAGLAALQARGDADIREALVEAGEDAEGVLSHRDLDELAEEGLLREALGTDLTE